MHRREKTAASRMDVRSAAGLGRGSHRSSHTPAPPLKEAQARREIPPSPPQVGLSRTASASGSPGREEVQGSPAPVWISQKVVADVSNMMMRWKIGRDDMGIQKEIKNNN